MKRIVFLLTLVSFKLFAQQNNQPHSLGATPTDAQVLNSMTLVIPSSGAAQVLPRSFRMDDESPPVNNQGIIGSCVSQATAYGLCGILAKRLNKPTLLSPEYMHYFIKQATLKCNDCKCMGSSLGLAANFLMNTGVPRYSDFHPDSSDINTCYITPGNYPIAYRLTSFQPLFISELLFAPNFKVNSIRYFVANRNPVPISMDIDSSFWIGYAFNNPEHIWRSFEGQAVGGHAMLIVGYDDDKHAFLVMNSWGNDWNIVQNDPAYTLKGGYCWIDYDIIEQHAYEAFVANVDANSFAITIAQLIQTTTAMVNKQQSMELTIGNTHNYFEQNRYQQFDDIRFIPTSVDKNTGVSNIAIYKVSNGVPLFSSAFDIKLGETKNILIEHKNYRFTANEIKPWRKYLKIFNSKVALFFKLEKLN